MRYPVTVRPGHPLIEAGIELVNTPRGELDDLRELH
jgi:hypothetical protein